MKIGILTLCQRKTTLMDHVRPKVTLLKAEDASPYLTAALPLLKNERRMQKLLAKGELLLKQKGAEAVLLSKELKQFEAAECPALTGMPPAALRDVLSLLLPSLCRRRIFQYIYVLDRDGSHLDLPLLKLLRRYGKYLCIHTDENRKTRRLEQTVMEEWGLLLDIDKPSAAPPRGSHILLLDFDQGIIRAGRDLKITGIEPDIPLPALGTVSREQLIPYFLSEYRDYGIKNLCIDRRQVPLAALLQALENGEKTQKKTC